MSGPSRAGIDVPACGDDARNHELLFILVKDVHGLSSCLEMYTRYIFVW